MVLRRYFKLIASVCFGAFVIEAASAQTQSLYTVNGESPPIDMQQMMLLSGFQPGAYFLHDNGDYGLLGGAPIGNINGVPPIGGGSVSAPNAAPAPQAPTSPQASAAPPPAPQVSASSNSPYQELIKQATGARIFWVYSPSIFSGATGGSSGYVHLCPGGVFYRSSEGSISVGGDYNSQYGGNNPWGGVAGTSAGAGRWTVEASPQGPMLAAYANDGNVQRVLVSVARQGSWKFGQTKYAIEPNRASCL